MADKSEAQTPRDLKETPALEMGEKCVSGSIETSRADSTSLKSGEDVLALQDLDPALNRKMHLVNNAIDEIGWTGYHLKLFFLNGFGYAVDSMIILFQSVIASQAFLEFGQRGYDNGLPVALYVGMFFGALFWGFSADVIGRRYAFNLSLLICSASTILCGAMPNWASLGFFTALLGFGGGGNLIMDTTVFLEYLPGNKQWLLTLLACWWGFGQAITGFIAWGFLVDEKWNCQSVETCTRENNQGWRYVLFTGGALVFVMSVLRLTIVRLHETPKYLLGMGKDDEVIEVFRMLCEKYQRTCSLTLEELEACGTIKSAHSKSRFSVGEFLVHLRGLFSSKKMALSTILIWVSWMIIGLAYPLFYVFLPTYLSTHGTAFVHTPYITWRNYALTNISGIFGPLFAGYMCNTRVLGRRYTMAIGALLTMAFFFAYIAVRTDVQDVVFSCMIGCVLNIYFGTLYAYTPEVLPSAHRGTGNGIAVALARVMGVISALVATFGDTRTAVPLFVCAGLFIVAAVVAALFPYEPYGRRSS